MTDTMRRSTLDALCSFEPEQFLDEVANDVAGTRLLIASPTFFPTYGGAQLRFKRYLAGLKERGIDTTVFTGTPTRKDTTPGEHLRSWMRHRWGARLPRESVDGATVHRVRLPHRKGWLRSSLYYRALLHHCSQPENQPEVIQFVSDLKPKAIPWLNLLRRRGIRLVFALTIAPDKSLFTGGAGRRRASRALYNSFDRIIVATPFLEQQLREAGVHTPVTVIPNGVDTARFAPPPVANRTVRDRFGLPQKARVVLAVGRVSERKGSHILLDAWRQVEEHAPDAHLFFVGPFESQGKKQRFRARLLKMRSTLRHPERVHLTGPQEAVEEFYADADMLVLASEREGMPNCVLEAMASRIPVLLTPYLGLSDAIGAPGEHFMMTRRSPEELAESIVSLLDDPAQRSRLAQAGFCRTVQEMSLSTALDHYAATYSGLALGSGAHHWHQADESAGTSAGNRG